MYIAPMPQERTLSTVLAPAVVALALLFALPAAGAQTPPEGETPVVTCEPAPAPELGPTCTQTRQVDMYTPPKTNWPPFLAVVGWVLIPLCLAVFIAHSRDESVVIAAILAFVLGGIGLVVVFAFLGRRRRDELAARPSPDSR